MHKPSKLFILSLLGALSVVSPFSIDMCLPAFPQMAREFHTSSAVVSLSLSSYFIGMALGQIFYGPFLDRLGRKPPLYFGLIVFIFASIGCFYAPDIKTLVTLRFIQAIGGCAAGVSSTAMVRDFFPANESAKVFSLLFLFIGASPLFAPSVGSIVIGFVSWQMIFLLLAIIMSAILALIFFFLPEGHQPDPSISLKPMPILREFISILKIPRFSVYAIGGAFSFAGLFSYVAGSPIIFMEGYHLSAQAYGGVFALLTMGFIGGNQINVLLLRRFTSQTLFARVLYAQVFIASLFLLGTALGWYGFYATMFLLFIFLACAGLTYPNAAALALEPFTKNIGSAASLLGFLQLGIGALISTGISVTASHTVLPIIAILAVTVVISLMIFLAGRDKANTFTPEAFALAQ